MRKYIDSAKVFIVFCDETRLKVLELLQHGEKCAGTLLKQVGVCQSTLSHHMKILVESGLINVRKSGKRSFYSISESGSQNAFRMLAQYLSAKKPMPQGR